MSLYELSGVARFFQRGPTTVRALDDVSLEIEPGEFVVLEGPSGSGKTTLLQILGALDRPSAGTVTFDGRDLVQQPDSALAELRLRSFGFVFQQFNLIPTLTAVENVEAKLAPIGRRRANARSSCSARSGSPSAPTTCRRTCRAASSSASRSRARSSVEPRVVLADEPTGNLDSATGGEIIDLLANLAAEHGSTVIVATHDASLAARAPRRVTHARRQARRHHPRRAGLTRIAYPVGMRARVWLPVVALFAASVWCVVLVVARRHAYGPGGFRYLVWNLGLAWLPLVFALLLYVAYRRRHTDRGAGRARRGVARLPAERAVHAHRLRPPRRPSPARPTR